MRPPTNIFIVLYSRYNGHIRSIFLEVQHDDKLSFLYSDVLLLFLFISTALITQTSTRSWNEQEEFKTKLLQLSTVPRPEIGKFCSHAATADSHHLH